jgi:hypothetical protein
MNDEISIYKEFIKVMGGRNCEGRGLESSTLIKYKNWGFQTSSIVNEFQRKRYRTSENKC